MYDLLQQMDRDVVQQEALKEHGEHSKLWCYEQALEIVIENMVCLPINFFLFFT